MVLNDGSHWYWLPSYSIYYYRAVFIWISKNNAIGFALTMLHDYMYLTNTCTKTQKNWHSFTRVFQRFESATCTCNNYFKFWLVHCIVCVPCDWPQWLLRHSVENCSLLPLHRVKLHNSKHHEDKTKIWIISKQNKKTLLLSCC